VQHTAFPPVIRFPELPDSFERTVLLIDKPYGWTSFDVIRRLRPLLQIKKIGHAGTLDPMATGLLICLVGRATKFMEAFMGQPKTYTGELRLGEATASFDAETPVTERKPWEHVTADALEAARRSFLGTITQRTPVYSAVKVGGERLYKKARRGEKVVPPERIVEIHSFEIDAWNGPDVAFTVRCSKGTYIRSLAHAFGEQVGTCAHLTALRRTAIGEEDIRQAWTVDGLREALAGRTTSV
jgi:tRNA pseudouridine55 synthase